MNLLGFAQAPNAEQGTVANSGKFSPKGNPDAESGREPDPTIRGKFSIVELSVTKLKIGDVTLDRASRTLSFKANVEVRDQILEYLLVHESGKVHESLLTTSVSPQELHLGVILLGANGASPTITLSWKKNGPDALLNLSDLITPAENSPALSATDWIYSGSIFDSRGFVAEREGSFISLLDDRAALIRHTVAASLGRDDVYRPATKKLPAKGVPVTVTLTFPSEP